MDYNTQSNRFKVIACGVLYREVCYCTAISKNIIDLVFLPQGLHDQGGEKMRIEIQKEIDKVEQNKYDAILLCYGLCNNGISGLISHTKMIIPRAHDCITLLLGSKEKYNRVFKENPGTYYSSPGWVERGIMDETNSDTFSQYGTKEKYEEFVAKYGEKKAKRLIERLGNWYKNYNSFLYIDTKVCEQKDIKIQAKKQALEKGLEYNEIEGTTSLLLKMFNGQFDDADFLIVPENTLVKASYDETIITI